MKLISLISLFISFLATSSLVVATPNALTTIPYTNERNAKTTSTATTTVTVPVTYTTVKTTRSPPRTTKPAPKTTSVAPKPTTVAPRTTKAPPRTTKSPPRTTKAPPRTTKPAPRTTKAAPRTTKPPSKTFKTSPTTTKSPPRTTKPPPRTTKPPSISGSCDVNVCFAIDGSGSITASEFLAEKTFVLDLTSVISKAPAVELAAVQYATANWPIEKLTTDKAEFRKQLEATKQAGGASFIAGGINYCFLQLFRRRREKNKIVIIGDGRSNIGSDAIDRADLFRKVGGEVIVIGAGFQNNNLLSQLAGGDSSKVYAVSSFLAKSNLQKIIQKVADDICS